MPPFDDLPERKRADFPRIGAQVQELKVGGMSLSSKQFTPPKTYDAFGRRMKTAGERCVLCRAPILLVPGSVYPFIPLRTDLV